MTTYAADIRCRLCLSHERYIKTDKCVRCVRSYSNKSRQKHKEKRNKHDREYQSRIRKRQPKKATGPWDVAHTSNIRRAKNKEALKKDISKKEIEKIRKVYQRCMELNELWGTDFVVDHIHPLNKGGKHEWMNLQLLDGALNYRKKDSWPWSYEIKVRDGAVIERHYRG